MSENLLGALINGGFLLVGAVIGALPTLIVAVKNQRSQERLRQLEYEHQERLRAQEYSEWYRRTLFEKRLATVQDAYAWLMKLNMAINRADWRQPDSPENEALRKLANEFRDWYDHNVLFLADEIPGASNFIGVANGAYAYASGKTQGKFDWDGFNRAAEMVKERARELMGLEHQRGKPHAG